MKSKSVFIFFIVWCLGIEAKCQMQKVFLDVVTNQPIGYASVFFSRLQTGSVADASGIVDFPKLMVTDADTVVITHVTYNTLLLSFKEFNNADTFFLHPRADVLPDVVIAKPLNVHEFRRSVKVGLFHFKYESAYYLRPGQQLAVRIDNVDHLQAIISSIKLHFEKIPEDAMFRIRLREVTSAGSVGNDLIAGGIIIQPRQLTPTINVSDQYLLFPANGVFVGIDYIGDKKKYGNFMEAQPALYRLSDRSSIANTYYNFSDAHRWIRQTIIHPGFKNPQNAQAELKLLVK
jgi:hypothetical protein